MSWIERAQDNLIIVTGDGKEYRPLWTDPKKEISFNVAQFEFPGVEGSIVSRGTYKGRKFPIEIYFVGDDHLDQSTDFEISSYDEGVWKVTHPYYGILYVHPVSINIDNTNANVSKISIALIETILEDNPKGVDSPSDLVLLGGEELLTQLSVTFELSVPEPIGQDKNLMTSNTDNIYNYTKNKIIDVDDFNNYFNLYTEATTAILNATDAPLQAMITIQAMINAPFNFADTIRNRFNMLKGQFDQLVTTINNFNGKRIYEIMGGSILGTMAQTLVTNPDYNSSAEVLMITEELIEKYDGYIDFLDSLQSDNGGQKNGYVPDATSMNELHALINYTVSKLLEISLDSKQERSVVLEVDSNVILLAHRFYGLLPDDSTIEYLINTNELGPDDILQIKAGRTIKYYV